MLTGIEKFVLINAEAIVMRKLYLCYNFTSLFLVCFCLSVELVLVADTPHFHLRHSFQGLLKHTLASTFVFRLRKRGS